VATDIKGISTAAQDQVLAAIKTTQAAILDGVRTWSSTMANAMPKLPAIPGMDKLPNPADGLELGFDFAERLLATQREFAEQLLGATQAVVTPAPAAKTPKSKA
jgi:hypothetical protein